METNQKTDGPDGEHNYMHAEPQHEHRWLQQLVGDWEFEGSSVDDPNYESKGTENVRSIGGLWIAAEGRGSMPGGGDATMIMTLGFDPQKNRFVGTWIGSMMNHLWIYDGTLDADERVLTLESEGPDFEIPGKMAMYRDVIELINDDQRTLSAYLLEEDGSWRKFMTTQYRRSA